MSIHAEIAKGIWDDIITHKGNKDIKSGFNNREYIGFNGENL